MADYVKNDREQKYPRLCAHRGYNAVAPENSMPAFAAAVALNADEIEFDLWTTTDGIFITSHDHTLERVTTGKGNIYDKSYDELLALDFGVKYNEKFKGLQVVKIEEILKHFACRVIMNVHVKIWDYNFQDDKMDEIVSLFKKYGCENYIYFMTSNDSKIAKLKANYPEMTVCAGWRHGLDSEPMTIVDRAIALGIDKLQFFKPYFNQACIDKAHAHGIRCNICWADDPEEAKQYFAMGMDTVMTNDYLPVYIGVKDLINK